MKNTMNSAVTMLGQGTPMDKSMGDGPTIMNKSMGDGPTMRPKNERGGRGAFAPGDVIARRYVVEQMLGEGGMGIVYQCLDKVGGVSVAVKCLPPEVSRNADEMEDIRANYRLVADLHHSNIAGARTLELDESTGDYYLVMDLARGMSLKRWMRQNQQATTEAKLAILRQVAAALDYAHARKVIHRDVKPDNVMVDDEGDVKVLDFGLAAQIRSSQSRMSKAVTSRSGTWGYMSPEQWRAKPQREQADVYSFGVMAYWMFAGTLPFDGDDPKVLGQAVLTEPVEPVAGLPAHMNFALVKALAKRPEERFVSCGEFVAALEGKGKFSRKEAGGPRPVAAVKGLLAATALGLAAFGGWWWMSGREGTKGTQGTEETIGTTVTNVAQVSSVTQVASPALAPKPIPPEAGLIDADVAEIAVEASVHKSHIERIDDADGFQAQKLSLADGLNRATANRKEKLWAKAAQGFTNYVNGCKELLKLDQERQLAKKSKADAEAAKARASEAEASQYAEKRWKEASASFKDANDLFGEMSFTNAALKYEAAAEQYNLCVGEAERKARKRERTLESTEKEMELDSQVTPLTGIQFDQDPNYVRCMDVNFAPVYFGFDTSNLASAELTKIEAVAKHLKQTGRVVIVEGHCDEEPNTPNPGYMLSLGELRAVAVRDYFVTLGISEQSVETKSYGNKRRAVAGHNEEVWSKNRRCEFAVFQRKQGVLRNGNAAQTERAASDTRPPGNAVPAAFVPVAPDVPPTVSPSSITTLDATNAVASVKGFVSYNGPTKDYIVKSGDSLGKIAFGSGITIRALKAMNGLTKDNLRIGQKLKIPAE